MRRLMQAFQVTDELVPVDEMPDVKPLLGQRNALSLKRQDLASRLRRMCAITDNLLLGTIDPPSTQVEIAHARRDRPNIEVQLADIDAQLLEREAELAMARERAKQRLKGIFHDALKEPVRELDDALAVAAEKNTCLMELEQKYQTVMGEQCDQINWPELQEATGQMDTRLDFWRRRLRREGLLPK